MMEFIKDPLRGFSFDRYPFRKGEGEKSIDFTVKMSLYTGFWVACVICELPGMLVFFGIYCLSLVRK